MSPIKLGANTPLNANSGTLPDMTSALLNWFQPMTFGIVTKTVEAFQVNETVTDISFMGIWQPLSGRQLLLKPQGQRKWNWTMLHSDTTLDLNPDDVILFLNIQYRVMVKKNYTLYQYNYFELVSDWTGSGPPTP